MHKQSIVVLFALCTIIFVQVVEGACDFSTAFAGSSPAEWRGKASDLTTCYNAITVSGRENLITNIKEVLLATLNLYSFTDIAKDSGAPYNIQTDMVSEVNAVPTPQGSDPFHAPIMEYINIVKKAKDSHLQLTLPNPYSKQTLYTPFCVRPVLEQDGTTVSLYAIPGAYDSATFATMVGYGADLSQYINKKITQIDGQNALDWMKSFAGGIGQFKDLGIQFNAAVDPKGHFCRRPMDMYPVVASYDWTFDDGSGGTLGPITIANGASSPTSINGEAAFANQITAGKKRVAERSLQEQLQNPIDPIMDFEKRRLDDSLSEEEQKMQAYHLYGDPAILFDKKSSKRTFNQNDLKNNNLTLPDWTTEGEAVAWDLVAANGRATVIKISSFIPQDLTEFRDMVRRAIKLGRDKVAATQGRLILDLTKCPGGQVVLAYQTVADLIKEFNAGTLANEGNLYPVYDFRQNSVTDDIFADNDALLRSVRFINPETGGAVPANYYDTKIMRNRAVTGGSDQPFSIPLFLNISNEIGGFSSQVLSDGQPYWFDKIIVLTDGRCGSTCAQFLNILYSNDRVRVIGVGGLPGEDFDMVSYPGGTAVSYLAIRSGATNQVNLPNAQSTFSMLLNWFESYEKCNNSGDPNTIPRDYLRRPPQAYIRSWNAIGENALDKTATGRSNSAALYNAVLPYFARMPSGLPSKAPRSRTSSGKCSNTTPFTPTTTFSENCFGIWYDQTECSAPCKGGPWPDGGLKTQKFKIWITGNGAACDAADGAVDTAVPCNTDTCVDCVGGYHYTTVVCSAECKKDKVYRIDVAGTQQGKACPYTDGHLDFDACTGGRCVGEYLRNVSRQGIDPFINCVDKAKLGGAIAYLGYYNRNNQPMEIPINKTATKNYFSPDPTNRGQPTTFQSGLQPFVMQVGYTNATLQYRIDSSVGMTDQSFESEIGCPLDSWAIPLRWKSTTTPTQTVFDKFQSCLTTVLNTMTERVIIQDYSVYGENIFQVYVNITKAPLGAPIAEADKTIAQILYQFATNARNNNALTQLQNCVGTEYTYTDIWFDWETATLRPPTVSGTKPDDQPPLPVPIPPPPAAASSLMPSAVLALILMIVFLMA